MFGLLAVASTGMHAQDEDPLIRELPTVFAEVASEFDVPVDILKAIAFVETRWKQRTPTAVEGEMPPSYGVMGLRDDDYFGHSLAEAGKLLGINPEVLKLSARQNIRGAAAFLRRIADEQRQSGKQVTNKLESWKDVVAKYSGIPQTELAELYAYDVFRVLSTGYHLGGIEIEQRQIDLNMFSKRVRGEDRLEGILRPNDYPGATWVPAHANNFAVSNRPTTFTIDRVVIHTTAGSYAGTISWFQNPSALVSAHYVVRSSDGAVTQMVLQKDIAYHAGNLSYNQRSVGIECEGWPDQPAYFTTALYNRVSDIVQFVCNQYGISKDRVHIVGHNEVPNPNDPTRWGGVNGKIDPGGFWNWRSFIQQVRGQSLTLMPVQITNASTLNVRTGPAVSEPLLTQVSMGQKFVSYWQSGGWYMIFMPGGSTDHFDGWVSGSYLLEVPLAPFVEVRNTWPSWLNVRTGTLASSPIIDTISDGQCFATTGQTQIGFDGWVWYNFYLSQSSGYSTGWSSGSYLTPLPVQLSSFTATVLNQRNVILQWTTLSEINNYGFYIQRRRQSDSTWYELPNVFIPGHGTTNEPQHYSSIDSTLPGPGIWWYRLKQVDLDGTAHFTEPISVNVVANVVERVLPTKFALAQNYPNPFNPSTTIEFALPKSVHATLKIFDLLGREVATLVDEELPAGNYKREWHAQDMASGVYLYRLQAGEFVGTKKLLLLR